MSRDKMIDLDDIHMQNIKTNKVTSGHTFLLDIR